MLGLRENRSERSGAALIVVLWVMGLLALLVGSLAFDAKVEARIVSYYRKRSKAAYIAKSGVELATLLMAKSKELGGKGSVVSSEDEDDKWREDALRLSRGQSIVGLEHELGEGKIILDIVPEPARWNINKLGRNEVQIEQNLEKILEVGGITEDTGLWPVLIESFLDWTDRNSLSRADGGETKDYYATLEKPYKAKNGPLDTVEELLLVKGYTREILFGGVIEDEVAVEGEEPASISGISDLLTTYGDGKVNINAAPKRVLMTLPGVDEVVAGAIIEEREGANVEVETGEEASGEEDYSFRSVQDLFTRIPEVDQQIKPYITTASTIFRITSVGEVGGVKKKVWCIASYTGKKLKVLKWREED